MPYRSAPFPPRRTPRKLPRYSRTFRTPTSKFAVESNSLRHSEPPRSSLADALRPVPEKDLSREWLLICSEVRSRDGVSNSWHPKFLRQHYRIGKAHDLADHEQGGSCK